MAQRRMFSKQVTNSSEFLMMSQSAQNLYFHFGMNADDDGFCEVFTIMRMTESKPDDLQALHARGLVYVVDNKICVVKDWHENNQIRLDRYKQSVYLSDPKYVELYKSIMDDKIKNIAVYKGLLGKPNGNQRLPQVRLGKVRLGKVKKENIEIGNSNELLSVKSSKEVKEPEQFIWGDYIKKLEDDKRRDLQVIGFYLKEKKFTCDTVEEARATVGRYLKVASQVKSFSDDKIVEATEKVKKEYPKMWTLDTIFKQLTK